MASKNKANKPPFLKVITDKIQKTKHSLTLTTITNSAHRLSYCDNKFSNVHGHTYKILVTISSANLNLQGDIMDKQRLDKLIRDQVFVKYDHKLILNSLDNENIAISKTLEKGIVWMNNNPTAGNIAKDIFQELTISLKRYNKNTKIESVTVYETPTEYSKYTEGKTIYVKKTQT